MPVTTSAKKKARQDIKRTVVNLRVKRRYKEAIKKVKEKPTEENLKKACRELDMAVKKRVIHLNKASRLKSRLAKRVHSK